MQIKSETMIAIIYITFLDVEKRSGQYRKKIFDNRKREITKARKPIAKIKIDFQKIAVVSDLAFVEDLLVEEDGDVDWDEPPLEECEDLEEPEDPEEL